jgi:hypothetical protein
MSKVTVYQYMVFDPALQKRKSRRWGTREGIASFGDFVEILEDTAVEVDKRNARLRRSRAVGVLLRLPLLALDCGQRRRMAEWPPAREEICPEKTTVLLSSRGSRQKSCWLAPEGSV